ncbi:hypothetical protein JAAARDRAFT_210011 [Jaapia argillacea MUCL 33604]|uniref:Protein kinase domain-containing protein n=1 Tax=Jaapia argillacea MUCL 33604 TaxID=933084 RepID=A0A067PSL6_9AGAM|nr:hypothetical protein JAAARDRAFT_210011 [Jaapia argillacea MUCL 33604]
MSASWHKRKARLSALLQSDGDEEVDGLALDRLLHGQSVIGKTSKTVEVDKLRFTDNDLTAVGTLEYGQYGVIDVVTCKFDNRVYVRKSIEKSFAMRTRDQCSPQLERDILLRARLDNSPWAPHLLCAFHTPTHLRLVMDYAEGGTLWDVIESSPHDGKIPEADLRWWAPQVVSAVHWCHSQGFVHRDIKPQNFVLTSTSHVLLVDFGSAAPLLPPRQDGSRQVQKRYCLVPCGTCDYISPEILEAHEQALVAMEMEDEDNSRSTTGRSGSIRSRRETEGYGWETDWWSLGAMLYEMAFGIAPFFAKDIRQTYLKIMDHQASLRFDPNVKIPNQFRNLLQGLLSDSHRRLGRRGVVEILDHPFFEGVSWTDLHQEPAPPSLHLPQFTYSTPVPSAPEAERANQATPQDEGHSNSQGFAFSQFFQSSKDSSSSPGLSILHATPSQPPHGDGANSSSPTMGSAAAFIGFTWGPPIDAFGEWESEGDEGHETPRTVGTEISTPRPLRHSSLPSRLAPSSEPVKHPHFNSFTTPMRPNHLTQTYTLPRTSTARRTGPRRSLSDREAMRQLIDCVGMSARKKVLESGRKPSNIDSRLSSLNGRPRSGSLGMKKELRFGVPSIVVVQDETWTGSDSGNVTGNGTGAGSLRALTPMLYGDSSFSSRAAQNRGADNHSETETDTDTDCPPSPSPSPRPGSAMSMSRRSGTPTFSSAFSLPLPLRRKSSGLGLGLIGNGAVDVSECEEQARDGSLAGEKDVGIKGLGNAAGVTEGSVGVDDFEQRHENLMMEICSLEGRLGRLVVRVNPGAD